MVRLLCKAFEWVFPKNWAELYYIVLDYYHCRYGDGYCYNRDVVEFLQSRAMVQ
ncbi:hypothetical protein [Helicobacter fennelliae]|uniref:Uncharacterized protein n=1 Tax=Helicobacter fennelliae MRY12-0050 TaxID=1325130 RepID=T1CS20_9HELI|nr:hypothetical protein [Helicobacter fennelliae]GAD19579.1 hypothetical protein HFN_0819 [Helicobacter fennelliae MRY12-0050]